MCIDPGVIPVSLIVMVNESVALTTSPVPETPLPFWAVMAKVFGFGPAGAAVPPQAAMTTPIAMATRTFLISGRLRNWRFVLSTPLSYAGAQPLSPPVGIGCRPCKRMGSEDAGGRLKFDKALVRGRDDSLQLGVDLQLLDHVTDVPLDGVGGDGKAL